MDVTVGRRGKRSNPNVRTFSLSVDAACAELASSQYGLLTRSQALDAGLSTDGIKRRVKAGLLIRVLPAVFRLTAVPRSWHQRAMAAHLWAGPESLISGHAAAALHRLDGYGLPTAIEIWTPRSLKAPHRAVVIHRSRTIEKADRTTVGSIPVVVPLRALIDVSAAASEERLEIALEDVLRKRLATPQEISDRLGRLPTTHPGRGTLDRLLAIRGSARPAESALEVRVLRMLRGQGYPAPIRQE